MVDLEEFLAAVPTGIGLYDKDFKLVDISDYILEEFEFSKDNFLAQDISFLDLVFEEDKKKIQEQLQGYIQSKQKIIQLNFRTLYKGSKYHFVRVNITKVNWGEVCFLTSGMLISDLRSHLLQLQSEVHQYKKLEHLAQIGLWEFDIHRKKVYWSEETYNIHKIPLGEEIDYNNAINFYHEDDRKIISDLVSKCIEKGEAYRVRLRLINGEGQLLWVETQGQAIFNKKGEVVQLYGTFQDVSRSVALEQENEKSILLAESYQEIMDDFAIVAKTDVHGTITYVNDLFCEISKFSREELIGQNHRIVNSGCHPKDFWKNIWGLITSGKSWRGEICNKAKDGSLYWVDTFISPLFDEEHHLEGFMAIRVDVTEQKKIEASLEMERERSTISAQLAAVGEMSAGIAHEINNPLSVIAGAVELCANRISEKEYENVEKHFETIRRSIDRIAKIIKGLKRVSYKSGSSEFEISSMKEIMDDTLDFSAEVLKAKGINLIVEELPDCYIKCRAVEISQVLLNLINNARDAILNLDERWIKIECFESSGMLRINVVDSGEGILEKLRAKIMEPFYTTKKVGKGTGLGLSLSKRIIEEHGGEFFIDCNCEHTCFSMILPIWQE